MAARRRRRRTRRANRRNIFVKVAKTGSIVKEVCLNDNRFVEDALDAASVSSGDKDKIRVNGRIADLDRELKDGDIVTIAGRVTGGSI